MCMCMCVCVCERDRMCLYLCNCMCVLRWLFPLMSHKYSVMYVCREEVPKMTMTSTVHALILTHTHTHTYTNTHTHAHAHTRTQTIIHTNTHKRIHSRHIHTQTPHTHTHTHTHTHRHRGSRWGLSRQHSSWLQVATTWAVRWWMRASRKPQVRFGSREGASRVLVPGMGMSGRCVMNYVKEVHVLWVQARWISRVGQSRMYTPYMVVYMVISLPKRPYIDRI